MPAPVTFDWMEGQDVARSRLGWSTASPFSRWWWIPVWLVGLQVPIVLSHGDPHPASQALALLWPLPLLCFGGHKRTRLLEVWRQQPMCAVCFLCFSLSGIVSAVLSDEPLFAFSAHLALLTAVALAGAVWTMGTGAVVKGIAAYSIIGTASAIGIGLQQNVSSGRLGGVFHPNTWGNLAYGLIAAALLVKSKWTRTALLSANLLLLWRSGSRSAFLAVATLGATLLLLSIIKAARFGQKRLPVLIVGVLFVIICVAIEKEYVFDLGASAFEVNNLTGRGYNSGFSGRVNMWALAWSAVVQHPVFGVGTRLGPNYNNGWSLHSGYLQVLLEYGVVGFLLLFSAIGMLASTIVRRAIRGNALAVLATSVLAAYYIVAIFEARILNAGNPTSIVVWILLLQVKETKGRCSSIAFDRRSSRGYQGHSSHRLSAAV